MNKKQIIYLALLAFVVLIPWLGLKEFYSRGEAREALVAQEMRTTGNYVLPIGYNGEIPSKPPVLHWMINSAAFIFGQDINEFTSRFPSAIASFLFLVFFAIFLQQRVEMPWLSVVILMSSIEWFRAGTTTRVDCLLSVFISLALLLLYRWKENGLKNVPLMAILFLGAAALTKGPIGLILPCAIFSLFLWSEKISIFRILKALSIIVFPSTLIALTWYLLASGQAGDKFWDKVYYENIARFTSTMEDEPHKHSIFYLYGTTLAAFMPWTIPVLWIVWDRRKEISKASIAAFFKRDSFLKFCIIWTLVIVAFFSIPSSKRSVYVLPAFPAMAVLASYFIQQSLERLRPLLKWSSIIVLAVTLAGLLACLSGEVLSKVGGVPVPLAIPFNYCVIAASLWLIVKNSNQWPHRELFSFVVAVCAILISVQSFFAPSVANSASYRSFAMQSEPIVRDEEVLNSFGDEFYGFSFYLKKHFNSVGMAGDTTIPDGFVYLYERNKPALEKKLSPSQRLEFVARSERGVVKKNDFVILARVVGGK